jgi:hypothetical protein
MVLQAMGEITAADSKEAPMKIYRIIVDPNQPTDLSKLTETEVDEQLTGELRTHRRPGRHGSF